MTGRMRLQVGQRQVTEDAGTRKDAVDAATIREPAAAVIAQAGQRAACAGVMNGDLRKQRVAQGPGCKRDAQRVADRVRRDG